MDGSFSSDVNLQRMKELFNINTFIVSQVNPHVIPFITSDGFDDPQPVWRRNLVNQIKSLYGNQLRHWLTQLHCLGLLPRVLETILQMLGQTYNGHVTIAPIPKIDDYPTFVKDVDPIKLPDFIQETYIKTMRRMSLIKSLYGIEREFERCFSRLKKKMKINEATKARK